MVGGGQCSSVIVVILTLLGDDRGAPSGWRIIHSNNNKGGISDHRVHCLFSDLFNDIMISGYCERIVNHTSCKSDTLFILSSP